MTPARARQPAGDEESEADDGEAGPDAADDDDGFELGLAGPVGGLEDRVSPPNGGRPARPTRDGQSATA